MDKLPLNNENVFTPSTTPDEYYIEYQNNGAGDKKTEHFESHLRIKDGDIVNSHTHHYVWHNENVSSEGIHLYWEGVFFKDETSFSEKSNDGKTTTYTTNYNRIL